MAEEMTDGADDKKIKANDKTIKDKKEKGGWLLVRPRRRAMEPMIKEKTSDKKTKRKKKKGGWLGRGDGRWSR